MKKSNEFERHSLPENTSSWLVCEKIDEEHGGGWEGNDEY